MASDSEPTAGDPLPSSSGCDSECSTPFVSAPSSPTRTDHHMLLPYHHHGACFFSAPASPTRCGGGGSGSGSGGGLDFDFDFSSRFPSPSAATMSSADELFCNGQIRPVRLAAALLQPQQPAPRLLGADVDEDDAAAFEGAEEAAADERGRVRSRSVRRKARSLSPFRSHWRRSPSPAPLPPNEPAAAADGTEAAAVPAASRSSSSSSTASSASSTSSSSSRGSSRRWGFFKDLLLHRSKSDGGKPHHHSRHPVAAAGPSPSLPATPKAGPLPSPRTRGGAATGRSRRRSAHERLYEARRAEAEELRRRTYLPYRQGVLLFGCIGLGSRGYGAVHGLARGLNAAVSSRS